MLAGGIEDRASQEFRMGSDEEQLSGYVLQGAGRIFEFMSLVLCTTAVLLFSSLLVVDASLYFPYVL